MGQFNALTKQTLNQPFQLISWSMKFLHLKSTGLAFLIASIGLPALAIESPTHSVLPSQPTSLSLGETQRLAQREPSGVAQLLFVNPMLGHDQTGDGSQRSPFRSITRALQAAQPNTVIMLAAGVYSQRSGEQFPITLPSNVRLQEDPSSGAQRVTIRGDVVQSATPIAQAPPAPAVRPTQPTPQPVAHRSAPAVVEPQASLPAAQRVAPPAPAAPRTGAPQPGPTAFAPIEIPVPPPASGGGRSPRPMPANLTPRSTPITEIPVPPPLTAAAPSTAPRSGRPAPQSVAATSQPRQPQQRYDLLPVPSPAPLGYIGDLPTIPIRGGAPRPVGAPVASRASSLGLRYRVIVRANDQATQSWVRSLFPNAFPTYDQNGDVVMQIGAFNALDNARDAAEQINQRGARAIIEELGGR